MNSIKPGLPRRLHEAPRGEHPAEEALDFIPAFFGHASDVIPHAPNSLGWKSLIHPQGVPYYIHEGKRILTNLNPQLPANSALLQGIYGHLRTRLPQGWRERGADIVVTASRDEQQLQVLEYYCVDYANRTLFWESPEDVGRIGLLVNADPFALRSLLRVYFYDHVYNYPAPAAASLDIDAEVRDLREELIHGRALDSFLWSPDECVQFDRMLELCSVGLPSYRATVFARIKSLLAFYKHYERWHRPRQRARRADRDQQVAMVPANLGLPVQFPWRVLLNFPWRVLQDFVVNRNRGLQLPWWTWRLAIFSLTSVHLWSQGLALMRDGSRAYNVLIVSFSVTLPTLPILGARELVDRRIHRLLEGNHMVALSVFSAVSLDLACYTLLLRDTLASLTDCDQPSIIWGPNILAVILLPVVFTMAFGVGVVD